MRGVNSDFAVLLDERHAATLEEVLAYLDACDDIDGSRPETTTMSGNAGSDRPNRRSTKRVTTRANRKRYKSEIVELRDQVVQLGNLVTQLRKREALAVRRSKDIDSRELRSLHNPYGVSGELQSVIYERRQLDASKSLNRKLKHALAMQSALFKALRMLMQRHTVMHDLDFVVKLTPPVRLHKEVFPRHHDLCNYLQMTYSETEKMVAPMNARGTSGVFNSTFVMQDNVRGKTVEFSLNAPVAGHLKQLDAFMWDYVSSMKGSKSLDRMVKPGTVLATGDIESQFTMGLNCDRGEIMIDGVAAVRRFVEPHRVVVVFTTLFAPVDTPFVIRQNNWLVMTDSAGSGSPTTLYQTCSRVYAERGPAMGAMTPEIASFNEEIISAYSRMMENHHLQTQDMVCAVFAPVVRDFWSHVRIAACFEFPSIASFIQEDECPSAASWTWVAACTSIEIQTRRRPCFQLARQVLSLQYAEQLAQARCIDLFSFERSHPMSHSPHLHHTRCPHTLGAFFDSELKRQQRVEEMSLFEFEGEHSDLLEEAFAFIETCTDAYHQSHGQTTTNNSTDSDSGGSDSSSLLANSSIDTERNHENLTNLQLTASANSQHQRLQKRLDRPKQSARRKSRADNTKAVSKYRKRTKAELENLRESVVQLTAQLVELSNRNSPAARLKEEVSTARSLAIAELHNLQRSQLVNRNLKEELARQMQKSQTLEQLASSKQVSEKDFDSVLGTEQHRVLRSSGNALIFLEFYYFMGDVMYPHAATISVAFSMHDTAYAFNSAFMKQDPELGQMYEFTSNTPLSCSRNHLSLCLWTCFTDFAEAQTSKHTQTGIGNGCERNYSMRIPGPMGSILVDGISAVRNFTESNRTVVTATSLFAPKGTGLVYRENMWFIVSEPNAPSVGASQSEPSSILLQSCYRLHLEKRDSSCPSVASEAADQHKYIMRTLGERARTHLIEMQDKLLHEFDRSPLFAQVQQKQQPCPQFEKEIELLSGSAKEACDELQPAIINFASESQVPEAIAMSFTLLLEDEHVVSLEEALAFLETCAPGIDESATSDMSTDSEPTHVIWSSSPSSSSSASSSPPPSLEFETHHVARRKGQSLTSKTAASKPQRRPRTQKVQQQQNQTVVVRQPTLTKSREANTKAVNRYRQRNKAEVQSLREQVEQLSLHVTKLRERVVPVSSAQVALLDADSRALVTSTNLQLAVTEFQKLQESEALNRKLKDALAKQKKMNKTLETVFRKQISANSLDFMMEMLPLEEEAATHDDAIMFREMLHYLEDVVYSTTATITAAIRKYDTTCVFSNSRMLQDPILGQTFEFTSNAPIPCTLQQLDARFWALLSGHVANQSMGQTTDQIVFVFTSLLAPADTGLLFREQAWLILSESSATTAPESSSSSVFQTGYRLFLEKRDTSSAITPQTAYLYNAIMTTQSDKMRAQQQDMQEFLLRSQDPDPSSIKRIIPVNFGTGERRKLIRQVAEGSNFGGFVAHPFLLDDELEALEAALAFVASSDEDDSRSESDRMTSSLMSVTSSTPAPLERSDDRRHRPSPPRRRRAQQQRQTEDDKAIRSRASNTRSVDRYRKRNKAEILELREQVIVLNARVAQLQNRKTGAVDLADDLHAPPSAWCAATDPTLGLEHAVVEYRKLQASELLNRQLKDAMAKQSILSKTIENLFRKHLAKSDMKLTQELTTKGNEHETDTSVFAELFHYVEHVLYANTEMIVSSISLSDTTHAFNNSTTKQDPMLGQVFEHTSNTPLACSAHDLEARAWNIVLRFDVGEGKKTTQVRAIRTPALSYYTRRLICCIVEQGKHSFSIQQKFTTTFDSEIGAIHIDGVAVMRKFVEADRVVIIYTTLLSPLASGLVFRENGCLVINDTSGTPSRTPTLLQSSYRLYLEKRDAAAAMSPKTTYMHSFVLTTQGERMRSYQQQIQNALLLELDFRTIVGQIGPCPAQNDG
ncbi:hypothetical protein FI667_g11714, partial [Globisporangium splendens]